MDNKIFKILLTIIVFSILFILGIWFGLRYFRAPAELSPPPLMQSELSPQPPTKDGAQKWPPDESVLPDEYAFTLSFSEQGLLILDMHTQQIYPCSNYPIEATTEITEATVTLEILRIGSPSVCLRALGPAALYQENSRDPYNPGRDLGRPRPIKLTLILGIEQDNYQVQIKDKTIFVQPLSGSFTEYFDFEEYYQSF